MTEAPVKKRGRPKGTGGNYTPPDPDTELERLIERRTDTNDEADQERLQTWRNSVRAYHERREEKHRLAWAQYERHMAELHSKLAAEHAQKAQKLLGSGAA